MRQTLFTKSVQIFKPMGVFLQKNFKLTECKLFNIKELRANSQKTSLELLKGVLDDALGKVAGKPSL